ncbi:hypothetical protein AALC17_07540 [Oscillospiraceae bacterium 38-13]
MEKAENSEKMIDTFSKMEDVVIKKILDFSGRMVHNGEESIRQNKRKVVAKRTRIRGRKRRRKEPCPELPEWNPLSANRILQL